MSYVSAVASITKNGRESTERSKLFPVNCRVDIMTGRRGKCRGKWKPPPESQAYKPQFINSFSKYDELGEGEISRPLCHEDHFIKKRPRRTKQYEALAYVVPESKNSVGHNKLVRQMFMTHRLRSTGFVALREACLGLRGSREEFQNVREPQRVFMVHYNYNSPTQERNNCSR